ncbi:MAG: glycosyltransferase family 2 protein [Chitinivibrionales bacterium]
MFKSKTVAVVIPAFNVENLIVQTITTIPGFVDFIIVINDCSRDQTARLVIESGAEVIESDGKVLYENSIDKATGHTTQNPRIMLLSHQYNQGVGAAIVSGYKWCCVNGIDIAVVMAGDGQMDPADLPAIISPVACNEADYCKGNRLFTGEAWKKIPKIRYFGNSILSFLTKIASGYWHVADSQSGYTAINSKLLHLVNWEQTYKRYGCPNDYLVRLNVYNARVRDVPVKPIYGIGEKSGINIITIIPKISLLLAKLFWFRMFHKYIIRDFHPLVFFYILGLLLTLTGAGFGLDLLLKRITSGPVAATSGLLSVFLMTMGIQFGLFAMWFDMDYNKSLK